MTPAEGLSAIGPNGITSPLEKFPSGPHFATYMKSVSMRPKPRFSQSTSATSDVSLLRVKPSERHWRSWCVVDMNSAEPQQYAPASKKKTTVCTKIKMRRISVRICLSHNCIHVPCSYGSMAFSHARNLIRNVWCRISGALDLQAE